MHAQASESKQLKLVQPGTTKKTSVTTKKAAGTTKKVATTKKKAANIVATTKRKTTTRKTTKKATTRKTTRKTTTKKGTTKKTTPSFPMPGLSNFGDLYGDYGYEDESSDLHYTTDTPDTETTTEPTTEEDFATEEVTTEVTFAPTTSTRASTRASKTVRTTTKRSKPGNQSNGSYSRNRWRKRNWFYDFMRYNYRPNMSYNRFG